MKNIYWIFIVCLIVIGCNKSANNEVEYWLTKSDETVKLEKQQSLLVFDKISNKLPSIIINENKKFQTVDGFGFSLTGGSAEVINQLNLAKKKELLNKLFGFNEESISISYLRISIGASDLDHRPFSYNDLKEGEEDLTQKKISLKPDMEYLVPLLKEILEINPEIKIMGSPWSPPVWMKDNNSSIGGSLQSKYYHAYATYFVKYIQKMKEHGIIVDAITPQNEPLHPGNNPSMYMEAAQQAEFIKNHLGPAFENSGIKTKIVIYDHNCDNPEYPISILNDSLAKKYINGSAFHLYSGDISALTTVKNEHPDKDLYFTEQYTPNDGKFGEHLTWHVKNVIIGSMRNWSKISLEWNLANNVAFGPHTEGGCTTCEGAITIVDNDTYIQNVAYYNIAHASKFVPTGSIRIGSNIAGELYNVAFETPNGAKVLIVENDSEKTKKFNIKYNGKWITTSLEGGSVATYKWD